MRLSGLILSLFPSGTLNLGLLKTSALGLTKQVFGGSAVTVHDDNGRHSAVLSGAPTGSHVAVGGNAESNERRSNDSYESPVGDMDTTVVVDYGVNESASSVICEYGGAQ